MKLFLTFYGVRIKKSITFAASIVNVFCAEVAESVDASVSKTDEVTLVPVRSRPSVRKKSRA